ncbi:Glycoprotein-N-acetylgalactosamine 3-beta-galactosyltransferase 1 [Melia azedarach]|uniref:Glycoprotein-N-acetylgalactosamine 3-beta-galactosyltransferase 1 n=1 Tax=Melia azedarach TaxID=155640 RepID=A0ACC1YKL4_MELAZ|nr:Glycoprotein-N-acetylgalactosamine 3-beta-galactosyltransferase 1 [Melia azedarach]
MSSKYATRLSKMLQNFQHPSSGILCKSLAISGLVLFFFYTTLFNNLYKLSHSDFYQQFKVIWPAVSHGTDSSSSSNMTSPTNISHIVFSVAGTVKGLKYRKAYIEAWWRPNVTRGYLFLDRFPSKEFLPWPSSSPPFRVNEDISRVKAYEKIRKSFQIRVFRTILETFREGDKDVRWYVMADDDTILFVDNLVEVLAKYDHTQSLYIGTNSDCVTSNFYASFNMAFGGAGYALSYPLVEALATKLDTCMEKYQNLYASDLMLFSCLADFGVSLTPEKGFHQIDLHNDISGLLSAHPHTPVISIHHLDFISPIFPSMSRSESINHLMEAAKIDHSRLLQQTICYHQQRNWSFSISWGYSTHIYENILSRNFLMKPLETFRPWWRNAKPPLYMFNTRILNKNPCEAPHVFFFHSMENSTDNQVLTTYIRASPRNLMPCLNNDNVSADFIHKIQVFSQATAHKKTRMTECCDVEDMADRNVTDIKLRVCTKDEIIS